MKYFIGFISATVLWATLLAITPMPQTEITVDCSIAEFHPDIHPKVKQACRELRDGRPSKTETLQTTSSKRELYQEAA